MDKTIRKYTRFDELKADEYRYWPSRPVHERVAAVSELTQEHYAMNGAAPSVPRLQRTLVRLERSRIRYVADVDAIRKATESQLPEARKKPSEPTGGS